MISKNKRTYKNKNGYLILKSTNQPLHRYVMEKIIGGDLEPKQVVHHKDGNKLNNKPSNLQVISSQHTHHLKHLNNLKRTGNWHGKVKKSSDTFSL